MSSPPEREAFLHCCWQIQHQDSVFDDLAAWNKEFTSSSVHSLAEKLDSTELLLLQRRHESPHRRPMYLLCGGVCSGSKGGFDLVACACR